MGKTLNKKRCVIIGGYLAEIDSQFTKQLLDSDFIICADRGYEYALLHGITPDLIIGDFDSYKRPESSDVETLCLPTQKDDTDLHFAAREGIKRGFKDFILTGVTGGRLDHTIASFSTLKFLTDNGASASIFDYNTKAWIATSKLEIERPDYPCYFSVFSFDNVASGVSIKGGRYILNNADLNNAFPIGVSNEFNDKTAVICVRQGCCLVLIVRK